MFLSFCAFGWYEAGLELLQTQYRSMCKSQTQVEMQTQLGIGFVRQRGTSTRECFCNLGEITDSVGEGTREQAKPSAFGHTGTTRASSARSTRIRRMRNLVGKLNERAHRHRRRKPFSDIWTKVCRSWCLHGPPPTDVNAALTTLHDTMERDLKREKSKKQ